MQLKVKIIFSKSCENSAIPFNYLLTALKFSKRSLGHHHCTFVLVVTLLTKKVFGYE